VTRRKAIGYFDTAIDLFRDLFRARC